MWLAQEGCMVTPMPPPCTSVQLYLLGTSVYLCILSLMYSVSGITLGVYYLYTPRGYMYRFGLCMYLVLYPLSQVPPWGCNIYMTPLALSPGLSTSRGLTHQPRLRNYKHKPLVYKNINTKSYIEQLETILMKVINDIR